MSILAYHKVDPRFEWGVTRVTPPQFARQVLLARDRGFTFLTISEYFSSDLKNKVAITFDDGYESIYYHAFPILQRFHATATVFVIPAFVGQFNTWDANLGGLYFKHMNWQQLQALSDAGWEIASHGMTHQDLTRLQPEEAIYELTESRRLLERQIGETKYVAFPFGKVNARIGQFAAQVGYSAGFAMGRCDPKVPEYFQINRWGIYFYDTLHTFQQKLFAKKRMFFNLLQRITDLGAESSALFTSYTKLY